MAIYCSIHCHLNSVSDSMYCTQYTVFSELIVWQQCTVYAVQYTVGNILSNSVLYSSLVKTRLSCVRFEVSTLISKLCLRIRAIWHAKRVVRKHTVPECRARKSTASCPPRTIRSSHIGGAKLTFLHGNFRAPHHYSLKKLTLRHRCDAPEADKGSGTAAFF